MPPPFAVDAAALAGARGAVVCMSGGMDSTLCAAWAAATFPEVAALHAGYGQRTAARERRAFEEVTGRLGIARRMVVDLGHLGRIGGSSLTDATMEVAAADLDAADIPTSYVPFRNAHFMCVAVSWAEVLGFDTVVVGAVEEDSSGYPDCRRSFYDAFEAAAREGTKPGTDLRFVTPLIRMSKAEIVAAALELGAPLELSWSCYQGEDVACGRCDSCALRLRGFERAGATDPLPYAPG